MEAKGASISGQQLDKALSNSEVLMQVLSEIARLENEKR